MIGVYQEYNDVAPRQCDRRISSSRNLMQVDPTLLTTSIPHPLLSGRCFTYRYDNKYTKSNYFL